MLRKKREPLFAVRTRRRTPIIRYVFGIKTAADGVYSPLHQRRGSHQLSELQLMGKTKKLFYVFLKNFGFVNYGAGKRADTAPTETP